MKNIFTIILLIFLLPLAACDLSQPPAKVEYHLENYYGYGDVQGPPTAGSKEAVAMNNKGMPVVIENTDQDKNYQPPAAITEENVDNKPATQVYTLSDKVGPTPTDQQQIIRNPVTSDTSEVRLSHKTHIVAKGETLFSIARQYDIPILPIIVANGLEPPYAVTVGQQLKIPEGKYHVVKDGETLYSISREYGVDMSGIVKLNQIQQPYNVIKGQKLQIPFPSDLPSEEIAAKQEQPVVVNNAANNAGRPASLRNPTGGILGVYKEPEQPVTQNNNVDTEAANTTLAEQTTENIKETAPQDESQDDNSFMWPVKGKVVKKFGQQNGEYNDGINIAVAAGTEVKAAKSGRVVYTGNSLKSYGNLVIIKHEDGLLTAYAHMNNVNVKKDQKISKGQVIGTVGSTGKVTSPQLYFAVRQGKEAKDPMKYLN